jgi:F-type H+/Na+-transporting ATPase subunit beta
MGSEYWVYEDMLNHTATMHHGDCRYCNHGAGMGRGRIESDSRWLGPYDSTRTAKRRAPIRPNSMLRNCGVCMK